MPASPTDIAAAGVGGSSGALPFMAEIQAAFGKYDVSGIRAHTDASARSAAADLGARAYAIGDDVAFGDAPDLHTAAHEAAHVIQQRQGVALKGGIDTPGDEFEVHADAVAAAVVGGRSAEPLLDRMAGAGRSAGAATPTVQRDTSTGSKAGAKDVDPADLPPPPVGKYIFEVTTDGGYQLWFNTSEVKTWKEPLFNAMRAFMQRAFPGVSDKTVREAIAATAPAFEGKGFDESRQWPENVRYRLGIKPSLAQSVKGWMRKHHPGNRAQEAAPGTGDTAGAGGSGAGAGAGTGQGAEGGKDGAAKQGAAGDKTSDAKSIEDVERARALYERLHKAFPDSDAWQSDAPSYPEFLAFLAEHADEIKKLPKGKQGARAASVEQLKKLLAQFEQHQLEKEGRSPQGSKSGHDDGTAGGYDKGTRDGAKDVPEGGDGGSRYGEKDGSKYGWIKWEPKGEILIRPKLDRYVAGSSINVELKWDLSVHPEAGLILLPNHCSYVWKTTQKGKVVDADGNSVFADDRTSSLDLGEKNGQTTVEVIAKSRHFKDKKKFKAQVVVDVVKEAEFDKQVFDAKHVGEDKTFSRDAKGNLQANPGEKALTVKDEITTLDTARGGFRELAKEGKLTEDQLATLEEQATNKRAALEEIQKKVGTGTPYLVRGTFVSREDSSSFELKLMMHVLHQKTNNGIAFFDLILHDLTMGEPTQHPGSSYQFLADERPDSVFRMIEGEALDAMADHFHAHNDYPKGTVHIAAQRLVGSGVWEKTLNTNNWRKKTKKALGTVAMVGGMALLVVPGGGEVAMGIMIVTGAAGAGQIALEIEDRIAKEGRLKFDRRLMMDVLQLASTALQFGSLSTALREASVVGKSRYMLAMVGVDAAQGFVIAADTSEALKRIDAETAVKLAHAQTDEEKKEIMADRDRQVAEVIGGAVVSGGFLMVSLGGGIKQVIATTRAGKQFSVREPVKALAEGSITDLEAAVANGSFSHENRAVVTTEAEQQFLEATLMQRKAAGGDAAQVKAPTDPHADPDAGKAPHERTTQQMPAAQDPDAGKAPHERTTQKMPAQDPEAGKAPHERTTQKMPAQDPAKLPGHEPTRVTFQGNGDTIAVAAAKVAPEPGYFDVAVHGDANNFYVLHNGSWVPVKPSSLRRWLGKQAGYHGQNIRLISCEAGAAGDGVAQAMANGMGVDVKAPTETLWVHDDGRITIGADPNQPSTGSWRDFSPYKKEGAAPTVETTPKVDEPHTQTTPEAKEPIPAGDEPAPDLQPGGNATEFGPKKGEADPLPPRKSDGKFVDAELEQKYQDYRARKKKAGEHPRGRLDWKERVDWWKENSPIARGNKFNKSVRKRKLYTFSEVNLIDGTRLDSYEHDGHPERISRKATDFLSISDAEFTGYVKEIDLKYPKGKKIHSVAYPELDGQRLRGDAVLEVPAENLSPTDPEVTGDPNKMKDLADRRARFEQIAADAGVELRYTAE